MCGWLGTIAATPQRQPIAVTASSVEISGNAEEQIPGNRPGEIAGLTDAGLRAAPQRERVVLDLGDGQGVSAPLQIAPSHPLLAQS